MKTTRSLVKRFCILSLGVFYLCIVVIAQAPSNAAVVKFTATTANLRGASSPIRIDVLAWSSDADTDGLISAWKLEPAAVAGAAARGGAGGARGAAGGRGGRGARGGGGGNPGPSAALPNSTSTSDGAPAQAGRGGRGGAGDVPGPTLPRNTPEAALAAALQSAKTSGYIWTSESVGYALKFARRIVRPDGSQRIILATERQLGSWGDFWNIGTDPVAYSFSVIELRLNANGIGEGRTSLTGKIVVDPVDNTFALADYASQPVLLKDVKVRSKS